METTQNLSHAKQLMQQNQFHAANKILLQLIQAQPQNSEAFYLLGTSLSLIGQWESATQYLSAAIKLNPKVPQFYHNLGLVYKETGEVLTAIEQYNKALQLNPNYFQAYHKLANAYITLGDDSNAHLHFQKALTIKKDYSEGWLDYGIFWSNLNNFIEAKKCYEQAIQINPRFAKAYFNYAKLLFTTKHFQECMLCLNNALKLKNDYYEAFVLLVTVKECICDWSNYETIKTQLFKLYQFCIKNHLKFPFEPFAVIHYDWDYEWISNVAKQHSKMHSEAATVHKLNFHFPHHIKNARLKIGYLSCGFNNHPTGHLAYDLFAEHDKNEFETHIFSHGVADSHFYPHFAKTAEHFFDIRDKNSIEVAKLIYDNQIDILIEMDGYIQGSRFEILALRPAPLQISFLGFPGSTGADFIDYFIADEIVLPSKHTQYFTEKIIYLPCYQINHKQEIKSKPNKSNWNLPEDKFIFCCFNNNYKIEPKIFKIWMAILKTIPDSILWLFESSELAQQNLCREASLANVNPDRLIFAKYVDKTSHLERLQLADLFLDTYFCNAHTTASDALWAGVPVLTCPGEHFSRRVAASLLNTLRLNELIVSSLQEYQERAVFYAQNFNELIKIKEKLEYQKQNSPLFNSRTFVRNLERELRKVWSSL